MSSAEEMRRRIQQSVLAAIAGWFLLCAGCARWVDSSGSTPARCLTCGFLLDGDGYSRTGPSYTGCWEFTHADGRVVSGTWHHQHTNRWGRNTWEWLTYAEGSNATGNLVLWLDKDKKKRCQAISYLNGKRHGFYAAWGASGWHSVGSHEEGGFPLSHIIWDAAGRKTEESIRTEDGIVELGWWPNGKQKYWKRFVGEARPGGQKYLVLKSHRCWDQAGKEIPPPKTRH